MSLSRFFCLLVPALIGLALFAPVLNGDFVYDDRALISLNPTMQEWSVVGKAFTTPYWALVDANRFGSGFYRPLGAATLGAIWQLGGASPGAFHLVSILLHCACATGVAALGLALGWRRSMAAAGGILFAVHGSHAEPVAWISAIPELLATFFSLLALRSLAKRQTLRTGLWLLAAMLCKEVAIGVWLLALGITWLRPKTGDAVRLETTRRSTSATAHSLPAQKSFSLWPTFLSLSCAALVVYALRYLAFDDAAAAGFDRMNTFHALDQSQQISLSFSLIGRYLAFLIWPWPHAPFRPLELGSAADATYLKMALAAGLVSLSAFGLWLWQRKNVTVLFSLGLLFAGLVPVMNTQALGQYPFEERFLYLPSAGFALLTVALLSRLRSQRLAWAAIALLVIPHAVSARSGITHWRDEETLFRWAREVAPNAVTGHVEYGRLMLERAQGAVDDLQRQRYGEYALEAYQQSLTVDPDQYFVTSVEREKGNLGLGDALYLQGDFAGAEAVYRRTVDHYKFSPIGYLGLANCRAQTALRHGESGHFELHDAVMSEALTLFETALLQDPHLDAARLGKANALFRVGRFDEALQLAMQLFDENPTRLETAQLLFSVQMQMERLDLAIQTLDYFLQMAPQHPQRDMVQQTVEELRRILDATPLGPPR